MHFSPKYNLDEFSLISRIFKLLLGQILRAISSEHIAEALCVKRRAAGLFLDLMSHTARHTHSVNIK